MPRERAGAGALDAKPAFAAGITGNSFVVESVESKGMLLMVVFKQSQMAQTSHPASKQMSGVNG
ncbi:MAG: hypothetical protein ACRDIV_09665 [Ktedonobacteraceae bacterium]